MPRYIKVLLGVNAVLLAGNLLAGRTLAQRPPELDAAGAAYLRVNINPTDIPPMVNINPNRIIPGVIVTDMPDVRLTPIGCQTGQNFLTAAGRSIAGPLMITYLNLPQSVKVTLSSPAAGTQTLDLTRDGHIAGGIFLQANQRLEFDAAVLYSGCRPA